MRKWTLTLLILPIFFACQRAGDEGAEAKKEAPATILADNGGGKEAPPPDTGAAAEGGTSVSLANVVVTPEGKDPVTLTVEVARSEEERHRGLQGRESLPEKHGMWFVFDGDVQDSFWMKGTPIALDLVFVDKEMKIIDMIKGAKPNDETLLTARFPYRYVLEINGGYADRWGLAVGDKVEFRLGPP